jgi:hypothetical protein
MLIFERPHFKQPFQLGGWANPNDNIKPVEMFTVLIENNFYRERT